MQRLRMTVVLALLAVAAPAAAAGVARGASARPGNLTIMHIREDAFRNYDFTARRVASNGVDWAVALVFWNNASINRVKNSGIGSLYDETGSRQHGRLRDNMTTGFVWDSDGGRKTTKCPGLPLNPRTARHYRIYADGDDRLYNLSWGYWVFGTTHWDVDECSLTRPAWFGWSEDAENHLVSDWRSRTGWPAANDWSDLHNTEPFRVEGDHVWDNNGKASALRVG